MNRGLPLAILALFFMYLAANFSPVVIWVIAGGAILSLIGLIFVMYQRGQFVGPGTLVDDARSVRDRFAYGDDDEEAAVIATREEANEVRRTRE